jgi:hypothetical protein
LFDIQTENYNKSSIIKNNLRAGFFNRKVMKWYETSHEKKINTQAHHYFGEFHTVAGPLQGDNGDTQSAIKYIEKIKV